MDEITAEELSELLGEEGVRIVDIRSEGAFARGHIPGSENVPFGELPDRIEEFDGADRIVTVCPIGESSIQAARLIASYEGVEGRVQSLAGGLEGWSYDTEAGPGGDHETAAGESEGPEAPF